MTALQALDRTLLLMRDEVGRRVDDNALLTSLTSTRIALLADAGNLASHSAQTAYVTLAMLAARSGQDVHLLAPNCALAGPQLPLLPGRMVESLLDAGGHLIPGVGFHAGGDGGEYDLAIALGDTPITVAARRVIRLNAGPWHGEITRASEPAPWAGQFWPVGGMTAAALGATEAFKASMWKLDAQLRISENLRQTLAFADQVSFALAPAGTPFCHEIGEFDCISGGAITNAVLYILSRIPGVSGRARVFDAEIPDLTNLNRYMLLLRSPFRMCKVDDLSATLGATLPITPIRERFTPELLRSIGPLADTGLIGVDHIPSRWDTQRANPAWLGIGATSHWDAMASFHQPGTACAQCLHPRHTPSDDTIPTVAFVSFWGGLLTAAYFLRHKARAVVPPIEQHIYMTPFRPEGPLWGRITKVKGCPTCALLNAHDLRPHGAHLG